MIQLDFIRDTILDNVKGESCVGRSANYVDELDLVSETKPVKFYVSKDVIHIERADFK